MIDNILVSNEVVSKQFVCNLSACKGACCVEGESGAPMEDFEVEIMQRDYEKFKPYMTPEGIAEVEARGMYYMEDGTAKTTLIGGEGGPCAYVNYKDGITFCGIEKAWEEGKLDFRKPVSCHLYPIRVKESHDVVFVNYFEWDICDPACSLGEALQVPVYRFLREPLIRRFGEEFYDVLDQTVKYAEANPDAGEEMEIDLGLADS